MSNDQSWSYGLSQSLPLLTIHRSGSSWINKRKRRIERQIIGKDHLLTNGAEDNIDKTGRRPLQLSRNHSLAALETQALDFQGDNFWKFMDGSRSLADIEAKDRGKLSPVYEMDVANNNNNKEKKVTFHPRHITEGDDSESDSEYTVSSQDVSSTLGDSNSSMSRGNKDRPVQRASSESKLTKDFHMQRSYSARYDRARTVPGNKLYRSSSDRTLPSDRAVATDSLQSLRKGKKQSLIKRKIRKIHKVFSKKRKNPLEESEDTVDRPLDTDDSDEQLARPELKITNGYLNGAEELDTGYSPPQSSSYPAHRKSKSASPSTRSSRNSLDVRSSSQSEGESVSRLKPIAAAPAALSSFLEVQEHGQASDESPRLTPTHSNFDDSQLISPSMGISYHPNSHTLRIQENERMGKPSSSSSTYSKQGSFRKKKRSGSWYNVLSPSYKQKNEDFHKFFKDLPATERLLVDYACALVKDILVQGRLYVSQNYLCFHSNILKWQTAVTVNLVDINQMTKEKTVKVIPNAIQFLLKDQPKITFTSFTARDRAYLAIFRLWQNALLDQPMSAHELWSQIHRNYGEELGGCSSDDDYVRPNQITKKHQSIGVEGDVKYEFGTTNKVKRLSNATQTANDEDYEKSERSSKSGNSSRDSPMKEGHDFLSTGDEKSSHSSRNFLDDDMFNEKLDEEEEDQFIGANTSTNRNAAGAEIQVKDEVREESSDESADFMMENLPKHSFSRTYATSVKDMYRIIFGDDCPFSRDTLVNKGTTGISFGTWQEDDSSPGQHIRELSYTLRLDNSFGPKTSFVKETQICYPCSVIGKSYIVDCIAQNYGIPYADYFYTAMRYAIRKVSKNSCELRITWELRYKKSPWGLVKNFIEKNVASGMSENFKKLQKQLQDRIDLEKSQLPTSDTISSTKSSGVRRRKRKSLSSTANTCKAKTQTSSESPGKDDGSKTSSDIGYDKKQKSLSNKAGSSTLLTPNGFLPNEMKSDQTKSPKLHYFGQGASAKFIFGAMLFLLALLLYSNYNMSRRLHILEQVAAAAAKADGVDPSVTAALLDRPGVPITSSPELMSTYLQAIDKRLRGLEDAVVKLTKESKAKWEQIEKRWDGLESLVNKLLKTEVSQGA